jgi:hypothetical protein
VYIVNSMIDFDKTLYVAIGDEILCD